MAKRAFYDLSGQDQRQCRLENPCSPSHAQNLRDATAHGVDDGVLGTSDRGLPRTRLFAGGVGAGKRKSVVVVVRRRAIHRRMPGGLDIVLVMGMTIHLSDAKKEKRDYTARDEKNMMLLPLPPQCSHECDTRASCRGQGQIIGSLRNLCSVNQYKLEQVITLLLGCSIADSALRLRFSLGTNGTESCCVHWPSGGWPEGCMTCIGRLRLWMWCGGEAHPSEESAQRRKE